MLTLADLLQQIAYGAYFLASIVSVTVCIPFFPLLIGSAHLTRAQLYLPRNWSSHQAKDPGQLMVGRSPVEAELASNALMSILRDGGQWDIEDDLSVGRTRAGSKAFDGMAWREEVPWEDEQAVPKIDEVGRDAIWFSGGNWK